MKKIAFYLPVLLCLMSSMCENEPLEGEFTDGPIGSSDPTDLVGEWALVSFDAEIETVAEMPNLPTMEQSFDITAENTDYIVTFSETDFSAIGSYDMVLVMTMDGETTETTQSLTDVNTTGTYTATESTITVDGQLVSYELNGMPEVGGTDEPQEVDYQITNNGQTLTITQEMEETFSAGGAETSTSIYSQSVWERVSGGEEEEEEPQADSFSSLDECIEAIKPDPETFTIDPTQNQTIVGEQGTTIIIPGNSIIDQSGNTITLPVNIELTEYLTLDQMFQANIQTVSNEQLLVTGGSFNLSITDENGNELFVEPWSVQAQIPVQTDIAGYENSMQYYVGQVVNDGGQEVVDWQLADGQEFGMTEGVFEIFGLELGLSNCDVLFDMAGETGTQFEVAVQDVSDYSNTAVWMFVEDFPSVVYIGTLNNAGDALITYEGSIPLGLNATLVAITVDEDSYLKFGSLDITVEGDDVFTVETDYGTTDELIQLVTSIVE